MEYISKKYIFRADGNSKIGVGHIMRTLTIAMALRKQLELELKQKAELPTQFPTIEATNTPKRVSDPILFICADEDSAAVVESRGFHAQVIGTAYDHMEDELPLWEELGIKDVTIFIDSYYTTDCYLEALKQYGRTVILDDLQEHAYPVDVVINYNVFANPDIYERLYANDVAETNDNYDGETASVIIPHSNNSRNNRRLTRYYLGAQYVPLREEFTSIYREPLPGKTEAITSLNKPNGDGHKHRNILITTGGGDQDNIAGKIYDTLSTFKACNKTKNISDDCRTTDVDTNCDSNVSKANTTTFHIVSGVFNPYFQQLKQLEQQRDDIKVYHDVQDMASLISSCDIAITAGGSTIYEICSLGVPLICFSYARNQEQLVEYIGEHVAYSAGAYDKDPSNTLATISELINSIYANPEALAQISTKEKQLVDGKGADRIANILRKI